jgi:DNA-3-methyladenine glycosylase II
MRQWVWPQWWYLLVPSTEKQANGKEMSKKLTATNLPEFADLLASRDSHLAKILAAYGPPPLWKRPARFDTMVRIVLEQQVSLGSAKATFDRLKTLLEGKVIAKNFVSLDDDQLRGIGFSRQKTRYCRLLGEAIVSRRFSVAGLEKLADDQVREKITALVGFGDWSADIYMMMALGRLDVLPIGDLGLVVGIAESTGLRFDDKAEIVAYAERWRPYRSVGTMMIWQNYLQRRGRGAGV